MVVFLQIVTDSLPPTGATPLLGKIVIGRLLNIPYHEL